MPHVLTPPAPPPVRKFAAPPAGPVITIRRHKRRYFRTDNATRTRIGGREIEWERLKMHGGSWSGAYSSQIPEEIAAITSLGSTQRSGITEIEQAEYETLTRNVPGPDLSFDEHFSVESPIGPKPERRAPKERLPVVFVHCVERHKQKTDEAHERVGAALQSWMELYKTGLVVPWHVWEQEYPRHSGQIGDGRNLPFLKDVLAAGLAHARDKDYVMLTNDDTLLHPKLPEFLLKFMKDKPAVSSGRITFSGSKPPGWEDRSIHEQTWGDDIGRDLFVMRKDWLLKHFREIPDFILGDLEWDLTLSAMIRLDIAGVKTTRESRFKLDPKCEIPRGYVFHRDHKKDWLDPSQANAPAKIWNYDLSREWCKKHGMAALPPNLIFK